MISISAEFRLVAACCRWPTGDAEAVRQLACDISWPRIERIAKRHRVEGLVWHGLHSAQAIVPDATATSLANAAASIAKDNMLIASESLRLHALFKSSAVPILFLKGLALGKLAYGTIAVKQGWDIDLLVPSDDLLLAARLLADAGYAVVTPSPPFSEPALARWHRSSKESVWRHAEKNTFVELHTALVDNGRLLPGLNARSPAQSVEILPGHALPTLEGDALFSYLCVHGASSAWFRLKWLADLAALIGQAGAPEVDRLFERSQELGAGRAAAQALLLARFLFGAPVGDELQRRLWSDRRNRWLFRSALGLMTGRFETVELHDRRFATLPIHLTQLALRPGLRFGISEGVRQIGSVVRRG